MLLSSSASTSLTSLSASPAIPSFSLALSLSSSVSFRSSTSKMSYSSPSILIVLRLVLSSPILLLFTSAVYFSASSPLLLPGLLVSTMYTFSASSLPSAIPSVLLSPPQLDVFSMSSYLLCLFHLHFVIHSYCILSGHHLLR